jgi:hypothetical protein
VVDRSRREEDIFKPPLIARGRGSLSSAASEFPTRKSCHARVRVEKHWLVNKETDTYARAYPWRDREAMEAYKETEIF